MGQTNDVKASRSRTSSGKISKTTRFDSSRFVQYELDSIETARCKAWELSADDLWGHVLALVDDGYSVTLKYDSWSEAYACFVQVRGQDDHPNAGLILAGRGSGPSKALKQALFKMEAIGSSWVQYGERRISTFDD